jgi:hypothetical protein
MVCLCDLRSAERFDIDFAMSIHYYLHDSPGSQNDPVFLLLSKEAESQVIEHPDAEQGLVSKVRSQLHRATQRGVPRFDPGIEAAYPSPLPLRSIDLVIVTEFERASESGLPNSWERARAWPKS